MVGHERYAATERGATGWDIEAEEGVSEGSLIGPQWQPRDLASLCHNHGWAEAGSLFIAVAVCLAESQGYQRAYNLNKDSQGNVLSKDCGLFQINIPASAIGTEEESRLFDEADYNASRAYQLFTARGFQPWYAYTLNVFTRDTYIRRATRGVGNYFADQLLMHDTDTLSGEPYQHTITTPVLHYQHSVEALDGAAAQAVTRLGALKAKLTSTANQQELEQIRIILANARHEAKN